MVLSERNPEIVRNGRRSRGPSPNGHGGGGANSGGGVSSGGNLNIGNAVCTVTPDTSSDDDNSIKRNGKSKTKQSEYEEKIRVGRDYQAVCPPLIPENERKPEAMNDRALLVWSPTKEIPDAKLEEYISVAKEKYGYNGEQALGMLFWHKHDLERAVMDLANFTPFPDEWTVEDKVLFDQAFQFHGKSFHRIRQMLPDKSIASLVKYYYSWKKTRHRQSVMDRQEKAKGSKEGSENGSDNGSNDESDNEDNKVQTNKQTISLLKRKNNDIVESNPDVNYRINQRWTSDECLLAVQGVLKFGKDFLKIAETIGTKTEAHVRTFYVNHRRRYNLDQVLRKHEAEKEIAAASNMNELLEAETTTSSSSAQSPAPKSSIAEFVNSSSNNNNNSSSNNSTTNTTNSLLNNNNKKDEVVVSVSPAPNKRKEPAVATSATATAATTTTTAAVNVQIDAADAIIIADEAAVDTVSAATAVTLADESDNTNSSETNASKFTNDEIKSTASNSSQKDNNIMEIDLVAESNDDAQPPAAKKIALSVTNQDTPKASTV